VREYKSRSAFDLARHGQPDRESSGRTRHPATSIPEHQDGRGPRGTRLPSRRGGIRTPRAGAHSFENGGSDRGRLDMLQ